MMPQTLMKWVILASFVLETRGRTDDYILRIFVDKLPAKYQRLVKLRYFEEYSYDEIAKELDAPLGTVKAQLHRARELMYDLVKNKKDHI